MALLAAFVQGIVGFGYGMVSMALLPLFLDLREAVPLVAAQCLVINLGLSYRHRSDLRWVHIGPLALGALVGVPLGVLALAGLSQSVLFGTLGAVMLLYAVQNLRPRDSANQRAWSPRLGPVFGLAAGALGAAFNTGGPAALLYVAGRRLGKGETKASLLGFFSLISLVQVPLMVQRGLFRWEHFLTDLCLVPVIILGAFLGLKVYSRLNPARFAQIVVVLIGFAGLQYLVRSLL